MALAFGLHPLRVESVAWVAERKDVLSAFFFFLALMAYTRYARQPSLARYLCLAALFVAALLAKPMAATLPLLLLILDWWPLRRSEPWTRLIAEKLPLLALSAASAAVTIWAQRAGGALAGLQALPWNLRNQNAGFSYLAYIAKMLWPVKLAALYPFPLHGVEAWKLTLTSFALPAIGLLAWRAGRNHPWIGAGWLWYVIALLPVIGLVQVGMQAMADRYTYIPAIGLVIPVAWEAARVPGAKWAALAVLAAMAALSWQQIAYWRDGVTLWTHALAVTRANFIAHDNLGVELDALGRHDEALDQYRETLRIEPGDRNGETNFAQASFAKGERLFQSGHADLALAAFRDGLRYREDNAPAHSYVGAILTERGDLTAGMAEFRRALALDPNLARAYMGLGVALARAGNTQAAERALEQSTARDANSAEAWFDLGLVEAALGKREKAVAALDRSLRIDPANRVARDAREQLAGH